MTCALVAKARCTPLPKPVLQIRSVRRRKATYTAQNVQTACLKMPDAEFDEFLEEITA